MIDRVFLYLERSQDGNLLKDEQLGICWKVVFLSDWHFLALLGHSSTLQPSNRAVGLYLFKMILSSGWLMRRLRHIAFDSKSRPEAVAGTPGCTKSSLQATEAKVSMLKKNMAASMLAGDDKLKRYDDYIKHC